ncbi:hypothetical protein HQO27_10830 [Rhodococcus fascians]|nr:hypothetical protein [Rhodococcus fascians]MBY4431257.1 hypothetical protein [Rhodococcus fascians]
MVCTDLLEEMRARLVAAQRFRDIDSPDEIRWCLQKYRDGRRWSLEFTRGVEVSRSPYIGGVAGWLFNCAT